MEQPLMWIFPRESEETDKLGANTPCQAAFSVDISVVPSTSINPKELWLGEEYVDSFHFEAI